jgi:uncharacterized protein YkwD
MKRFLLAVLLLCTTLGVHAADARNEITAENVVRLMNLEREDAGLPPLSTDPRLAAAAADRMRHMEEEGFWAHESPAGVTPFTWLRVHSYDFARAGENLAAGFETARMLVASWMESPGHRANILSPEYQDCGIAVIDGATTGPATGRSVVVMFGKKRATFASTAQ